MDRVLRLLAAVAVSLSLAACGSERVPTGEEAAGVLAPETAAAAAQAAADASARNVPNGPKLTVMTRNLYLGADITMLTEPDVDVLGAATQIWVDVQRTDFPSRARVIADEVFWARPEVLGLQEVTLYRTGPARVCMGEISPASPEADHVELDFLAILLKELRRRGLTYEAAAQVTTMDTELCIVDVLGDGELRDLRYTDREVLLVRKDVRWRNPTLPGEQPIPGFVPAPVAPGPGDRNGGVYAIALVPDDPGMPPVPTTAFFEIAGVPDPIYSWRGWTAVEVEHGNRWVRIFETHVEDQLPQLERIPPPDGPLPVWFFQIFQDAQLVAILDASLRMAPLPTIAIGDFNVYKPQGDPIPYAFLTGGDFPFDPRLSGISPLRDAWTALRPDDPGFTWGFDALLRSGELKTTLDLVLSTGGVHPISTYLVGTKDLTPGGLHPSDHAGIVTTFSIR